MTRPSRDEGDVVLGDPLGERPVGDLEHRAEPVAVGLVRAEQPEGVGIAPIDVAHQLAEPAGRLGAQRTPGCGTSRAYSRKSGRSRSR